MPQNNKGIRNISFSNVTGCELEKSDSILGKGTDFNIFCYIQNGIEFYQPSRKWIFFLTLNDGDLGLIVHLEVRWC